MGKRGKGPYLVVHGHFYQPPRENPWTEMVEREKTAFPYHNWNQRISHQCYRPNSAARIVDGEGKILDIVNNYSLMSFNFGPTLLSWLEDNDPVTYLRILEADRRSIALRSGHENALAQVYNHLIMPLAIYRDKWTQVRWGIEDFKFRFGREPEGMWLPETAVDEETLSVLAENGIKFTILAPHQAKRVRRIGGMRWRRVTSESLDTTKVYRCFLKGQHIDIFFYNGPISYEISFGDFLKNGELLAQRLREALRPRDKGKQLILVATDGETFGHHKPFGEMALAYILSREVAQKGLRVTNLGQFVEENPPQWEVEIDEGPRGEGSSWSCSHGVGRWKEDCGCSTGGQPHWNQGWRKSLREGLDWLRDKLAAIYEREGGKYLRDVWQARDEYIKVILDRSPKNVNKFFKKIQTYPLNKDEKIRCLKLLEIQRNAMLMFTSCGWFFADISGLESVQILKYAARAVELAKDLTQKDLEKTLLQFLRKAKSNLEKYEDGEKIYLKQVKPIAVPPQVVMANYALRLPFRWEKRKEIKISSYQIADRGGRTKRLGREKFAWGKANLESLLTREEESFLYLTHFQREGRLDCWIKRSNEADWPQTPDPEQLISQVKGEMGWKSCTPQDLSAEWREEILGYLQEEALKEVNRSLRRIYKRNLGLIKNLQENGGGVPQIFRQLASFLLILRLEKGIEGMRGDFEKNFRRIVQLHSDMENFGYLPPQGRLEPLFSEPLSARVKNLVQNLSLREIKRIDKLLDLADQWGLQPDLRGVQEDFYPLWKGRIRAKGTRNRQRHLNGLAEKLGFSV